MSARDPFGSSHALELTNIRPSVARLGPELLCIIFKMLKDDAHASGGVSHYSNHGSWAAVTHVSRTWRLISLGHAPLWDVLYLGVNAPDVDVATFLTRSKDAPLTIVVYTDFTHEHDIPETALAFTYAIDHHWHRLKALDIHSCALYLYAEALLSSRIFPVLTSIQCTNTDLPEELDLLRADAALRFPSLTALTLRNVTLLCSGMDFRTSPPFLNLIDFQLTVEEGLLDQDPGILGLLSKMPALRKLYIGGAFPSSADISTAEKITLPDNLALITFHCNYDATSSRSIAFLKKLDCPTAKVVFFASPLSALPLVDEYFGTARPPAHIFITVTDVERASISTGCWSSTETSPSEIVLNIAFNDEDRIDGFVNGTSLHEICASVDCDQLAAVTLTCRPAADRLPYVFEHIWMAMNGPAVTIVCAVGRTSIRALLRLLSKWEDRLSYNDASSFSLELDESEGPYPLTQNDINGLMGYASARKSQGIPISQVNLWSGAVGEESVSDLRKHVDSVLVKTGRN